MGTPKYMHSTGDPLTQTRVPHLRDGFIVANRGPRQLGWWGELRWAIRAKPGPRPACWLGWESANLKVNLTLIGGKLT